jgi:hypothetical protein
MRELSPRTAAHGARLFALLNLSLADSVVAFHYAKYTYNFWRPVTAIRAADPRALRERKCEERTASAYVPITDVIIARSPPLRPQPADSGGPARWWRPQARVLPVCTLRHSLWLPRCRSPRSRPILPRGPRT